MARKIIHCDCDCFYAAIEIRDNPSLQAYPVAVGGASDRRGVISTCNYTARKYGVHSAMASAHAKRLCPELIILPGNMEKYRQASTAIHDIFQEYTDSIEPLSLDEAFLDVSNSDLCRGSASWIAEEIRQRIYKEIGITVSAGVAPNKFLAKIASDWHKPNGQFVIPPNAVDEFVKSLAVNKLLGVGKVTTNRLHQLGIYTCGDIRQYTDYQLIELFGIFGKRLHQLSYGIDERPVCSNHSRKSLSVEHTYPADLPSENSCLQQLPMLHEQLLIRLQKLDRRYQVAKAFIKVKFHDFIQTTAELCTNRTAINQYHDLCHEAFQRGSKPVRLLGIGVRFKDINQQQMEQIDLFQNNVVHG